MKLTMLKYILFILSEAYDRAANKYREGITEKLRLSGVQADFMIVGSGWSFEPRSIDKEHTLIVTDTVFVFDSMFGEGFYVIALYHDGNKKEVFSGAGYAVEDLPAVEYGSYQKAFDRLAGIPWDILETGRMKVRETIPEDVDDFYRIYSNPSITRYMEDLFPDRNREIEYLRAYVEQVYHFYGFGLWTVIHKKSGQVIGRAGLNVREGYEIPELGFVIDAAYQRQGYGFEVCSDILKYAEEELDFSMIQAFVNENNRISIHLLEKLGFAFDSEVDLGQHYHRYLRSTENKIEKNS